MSALDEFLKGATAVAPAKMPPPAPAEPTTVTKPKSSEPSGVIEIILPSGIELYFQEEPRRFYRVRQQEGTEPAIPPVENAPDIYRWREVPSTTEITKILDKPGLVHWGEECGVHSVQELLRRKWIDPDTLQRWSVDMVREVAKHKGLRTWQVRDKAGKRGTSVHKALEGWAMSDGVLVDPDLFPEAEQGFAMGLNRFLSESGFVPLKSEVLVASLVHGFAGRFDMMGRVPEPVKLVTKLTKAGVEHRSRVQPDSFLVDLKTSSGVYDEYHLQVAGYQGICEESGYERPNKTAILRVTVDGRYEFVPGQAEWLDFWWCKGLFDSLKVIKERVKYE